MPKFYQPQDRFFKKAKEKGYRARSAFKLEEIQRNFHIIKLGNNILDLGAAPGSFMQYESNIIGQKGMVIGIDLKPITPLKQTNIKSYESDIFNELIYKKIEDETGISVFDVITSDLAPSTSGIKSLDAGRSFQLNEQVIRISDKCLKNGGNLLMKAFPGADHSELIRLAKERFRQVKVFIPEAVRKTSREVYIICIGKRKPL